MPRQSTFDKLPLSWQRKIQSMRAECARNRVALREARAENERLRAELDEVRGK